MLTFIHRDSRAGHNDFCAKKKKRRRTIIWTVWRWGAGWKEEDMEKGVDEGAEEEGGGSLRRSQGGSR